MKYLIGVGVYVGYDDSVGLRLIEHVSEGGLEKGFRAVEIGGNMLNLFSYLEAGVEKILVVDSAKMGKAPGDYMFFKPEQVESQKVLAGVSTHEGDVLKTLELARQTGYRIPPIEFMGIEPKRVEPEMGLSPELERRLPEYAAAAVERLTRGTA
ncbi:MAG: hydrogenase maturation protease [Elusimicrobiota bacterium]